MQATTETTAGANISAQDTLNDIVGRYPQTLPLLQQYGLDTCCGGMLSLATAAEHHGLALDELLAVLRGAGERAAA